MKTRGIFASLVQVLGEASPCHGELRWLSHSLALSIRRWSMPCYVAASFSMGLFWGLSHFVLLLPEQCGSADRQFCGFSALRISGAMKWVMYNIKFIVAGFGTCNFEHLPSVTSYFHFSVKKRTSPLWHLMIEFRMFYLMWTFRVQVDCVVNAWPLHSFVLPCCCDCGLLTVNAACLTVAVDPVAPA